MLGHVPAPDMCPSPCNIVTMADAYKIFCLIINILFQDGIV